MGDSVELLEVSGLKKLTNLLAEADS